MPAPTKSLTTTESSLKKPWYDYDGDLRRRLIAGGRVARKNSWPWIVLLQFYGYDENNVLKEFICGGTLIEKNWVLTAGHCCADKFKVDMIFGEHDRRDPDNGAFAVGWFSNIIYYKISINISLII